jgi:CD109 antigen
VWLWRDANIGPHGRFLFNIPVPSVPAHWTVSAFGVSATVGYGVLPEAIEVTDAFVFVYFISLFIYLFCGANKIICLQYVGVLPFSMIVEMPRKSRQGEQVGIRVAVFNYQPVDIEATVVLSSSKDYKFVHVEEDGYV